MAYNKKVVLVTGAAQGIGEAIVRAYVKSGLQVAAIDKNTAGLKNLTDQLGRTVSPYTADVADSQAVEQTVAKVEKEIGPIGILVNAAGVLRTGTVLSLNDEDWAYAFSVNTNGTFYFCRAVARKMVPRKAGVIVNISSNASSTPRTTMSSYCASKAAITIFTKCLGLELAEHNIRCNVVSPGSTDTPMQRSLWTGQNGEAAVVAGSLESYRLGIPLKKMATSDEIADAVVFMASDQAQHITMEDLRVDGGATLGC